MPWFGAYQDTILREPTNEFAVLIGRPYAYEALSQVADAAALGAVFQGAHESGEDVFHGLMLPRDGQGVN